MEEVLTHAAHADQGRGSEGCRRLTCLVLFGPDGRPGPWLVVLALACALVAGITLGTPAESPAPQAQAATVP